MKSVHKSFAATLLSAIFLFSASAWGDEQSELDKGRNAFLARKYDEAAARFRSMLDPVTGVVRDPIFVSQARFFWGAALLAQHKTAEATELFEAVIMRDPQFEPDPLSVPTEVIDAFIDARARLRGRLNDEARRTAAIDAARKKKVDAEHAKKVERTALLEKLASEERVITKHSRMLASVPFGVGQFQNGSRALGWVFLTTEIAFLAAGTALVPAYLSAYSQGQRAYANRYIDRAEQYLERANAIRYANLAMYGAFAATALVGVIEAHVNFVPTVEETKYRELPPVSHLRPFAAPTVDNRSMTGGILGVSGYW